MARFLEVLLDIDLVVAEGRFRFGPGGAERVVHVGCGTGELHAATAATGGGLDDHRIAELLADRAGCGQIRNAAVRTGNDRNTQVLRGLLGGDLVAHDADMLGRRTDEGDFVILDDLYEIGVLGQKPVTGMDRLRTCDLAGGDDAGHRKIGQSSRGRADTDAFIGHAHMHGIGIRR